MPRKRIAIVLPEVDRVRWQYAADLTGQSLERFVRNAVEDKLRSLSEGQRLGRERASEVPVPSEDGLGEVCSKP